MTHNGLILSSKEEAPQLQEQSKEEDFAAFIKNQRNKLYDDRVVLQKVSTRSLAKQMGISYEMFRKIINKRKPTKKRDFIIALCAILFLDPDQTNEALSLYGMSKLDEGNYRDSALMGILDYRSAYLPGTDDEEQQIVTSNIIQEINDVLSLNHYPTLDLADKRNKDNDLEKRYPYTLLKKRAECGISSLLYGEQSASLQALYSPDKYRVFAEMWIVDEENNCKYHLTAEPEGYFTKLTILEKTPQNGGQPDVDYRSEDDSEEKLNSKYEQLQASKIEYEQFQSLAGTGRFRECFMELKRMAASELKSALLCIKDTKNYVGRKSARIIDGHIHVFFEEYNYLVPELGEYYMLDYSNGEYDFSVSDESRFMELYLNHDQYDRLYKKRAAVKEKYSSIENIHNKMSSNGENMLLNLRCSSFNRMKDELNTFIRKIREGKLKIRILADYFDDPMELLRFYKLDKDHCEIGDVPLTLDDLIQAFELGLDSIEDIQTFLRNCKQLQIDKIL